MKFPGHQYHRQSRMQRPSHKMQGFRVRFRTVSFPNIRTYLQKFLTWNFPPGAKYLFRSCCNALINPYLDNTVRGSDIKIIWEIIKRILFVLLRPKTETETDPDVGGHQVFVFKLFRNKNMFNFLNCVQFTNRQQDNLDVDLNSCMSPTVCFW